MTPGPDFDSYIDVAERIRMFRDKHPDGSLRPHNPDNPVTVQQVGDNTYLQYVACAYRSPDDPAPGIGVAWEKVPGKTSFTRDSEAMVVETSAWGRAIVAVLAADTKKVASADEVRNRPDDNQAPTYARQAADKADAAIRRVVTVAKQHDPSSTDADRKAWIQTEMEARDLDMNNPDHLGQFAAELEQMASNMDPWANEGNQQ